MFRPMVLLLAVIISSSTGGILHHTGGTHQPHTGGTHQPHTDETHHPHHHHSTTSEVESTTSSIGSDNYADLPGYKFLYTNETELLEKLTVHDGSNLHYNATELEVEGAGDCLTDVSKCILSGSTTCVPCATAIFRCRWCSIVIGGQIPCYIACVGGMSQLACLGCSGAAINCIQSKC